MESVAQLLQCLGPLDLFVATRLPHDRLIRRGLTVALPLAGATRDEASQAAGTQAAGAQDGRAQGAGVQAGSASGGPPLPGRLIWGGPLLRRAAQLGVDRLPVHDVAVAGSRDALFLALDLEARTGEYSWEEREAIYRYAVEQEIEIDVELSQLVTGDGSFADAITRYLRLSPRWQRAVEDGSVDIRTAEACGSLPAAVLAEVSAAPQRLSFSNRRRLLGWLTEICGRDGLHEAAAVDLARQVMRGDDPVEAARLLRYPRLSTMESRFRDLERELTTGVPVSLVAPQGFEGAGFEVQLRLRSVRDIDRAMDALRRIQERGDELFDLL